MINPHTELVSELLDRALWLANGQDDPHSTTLAELCATVESLQHRLTACEEAGQGWQPIETAPRDGTPFLGWDGGVALVAWVVTAWGRRGWSAGNIDSAPEEDYEDWLEPTHWQPLPAAPAQATE